MDYVRFGNTGLEVSRLCLGGMSFGVKNEKRPWVLGLDEARPVFRAAWEGGINFVDTANVYAAGTSEEIVGTLIKELAAREEIVLATKVRSRMRPGPNGMGLSRKAIMREIDDSLRRLQTDYVDIYQIHRADMNTPFEETMEALNDVVKAGKARYIGASSMHAWQFLKYQRAAERIGGCRFVSMQNQVNLVYREEEREMLPLCRHDGIALMPWAPLAAGKLARPWGERSRRSKTDVFARTMYDEEASADKPIIEAVERVASRHGVRMAEIALAWVLQVEGVTVPVIGSSRSEHVKNALAALEIKLDPEEVSELETPYRPRDIEGFI